MAATKKASVPKANVLGRTLDEVIAAMPPESQARIAERTTQLQADVEGLKALRKSLSVARSRSPSLGVKQPAIVKIERQTDLHPRPCAGSWKLLAARWDCGSICPAPARSR